MTNYKKTIGPSLVSFIIWAMSSISAYGQSRDFVIQRMDNGDYSTAITILEGMCNAYPGNYDYAELLTAAKKCRTLQNEGQKFARQKRYSNAIAKYQAILQIHPGDKTTTKQIEICTNAEMNLLHTYTNSTYGYSIKLPRYMNDAAGSQDHITFTSVLKNGYTAHVFIDVKIDGRAFLSTSTRNLLEEKRNSIVRDKNVKYNTITIDTIKDDWMVVSGRYQNGNIFYNKTFVKYRSTQKHENVRIVVSANAVVSPEDARGNELAEYIANYFYVNQTGQVYYHDTDKELWEKAQKTGTIDAYSNYLRTIGSNAKHKEEAECWINLFLARECYYRRDYGNTIYHYQLASKRLDLGSTDSGYFNIACEENDYSDIKKQYPIVPRITRFCDKYPNSKHLPELRGLLVKAYCLNGDYKSAQKTVDDYWPDILTPESQSKQSKRFWKGIIRQYKKQYKKTKSNSGLHNSTGGRQAKSSFGHMWEFGTDWRCNGKSYWGVNTAFCIGTLEKRFNLDFRINPSVTFSKNLDKELYPRWFCPITMGTRLYLNPGHGEDWFCYVEPEVGYSINASGVFGGRFVFGYDIFGINIGGLWTMTSMPYNTSNSKFVYAGIGINIYLWN